MNRRTSLLLAVLVVVVACSKSGADLASDICAGPGLDYVRAGWGPEVQVVESVASDGRGVAEWLTTPGRPVSDEQVQSWRESIGLVAVCYYDGDFSGFPAPQDVARTFDRMLLLVPQDGEPIVQSVGPRDALAPRDGPGSE